MVSLSQLNQLEIGNRWACVRGWLANSWRMVGLALLCVHASVVYGQEQSLLDSHGHQMPPGAIGHRLVLRGEPSREYIVQPVRLTAPDGAVLATYDGSQTHGQYGQLEVGLQVNQKYRFHVSEMTHLGGWELYPSVELIDRLYPPQGREREFPIIIELTGEDLKLATQGKYVTRVIYVEDPADTFPYDEADPVAAKGLAAKRGTARDAAQRYFEAPPGEDPYHIARELGRPVAILRIGNRGPVANGDNHDFSFGSQPAQSYGETTFPGIGQLPQGRSRPSRPGSLDRLREDRASQGNPIQRASHTSAVSDVPPSESKLQPDVNRTNANRSSPRPLLSRVADLLPLKD